jgi:hypothetical protein
MYFALVMTAKGSAQMILRNAERHNGAACWRALCRRFEPATAVRAQSIMQGILNVAPFPSTVTEFEEKHGAWERDIRRYEAASGEVFNIGVKKSVFLQNAPKSLRVLLQMQSTRPYDELVNTTVQYLQVSGVYEGGMHKADKPAASSSTAMEVDALTRKGKPGKGKDKGKDKAKGKSDGVLCFECGKPGHYARDCWHRQDPAKPKDKGKGKGKGKGGAVHEITADTASSAWASSLGPSASAAGHIQAITAQPYYGENVLMRGQSECEEKDLVGGYIFALTGGEKEDNSTIMMLTDNCADEHVCGVEDFSWLPLVPSRNPGLVLADGSPLAHYGMRRVPLQIAGERTIIVEFQVTDVRKPILSVGKFCDRASARCAWYDSEGGYLRHESAGLVKIKRVANHYALECWSPREEEMRRTRMLAPIVEGPAARAADDVMADAEAEGALAISEEGIHEEEVQGSGLRGPQAPNAEDIERHWLTHTPAQPWCEVCVKTKANDLAHKSKERKDALIPLIQFDYAEAGEEGKIGNFEFAVGSDLSTGSVWATAIIQKGREDPYTVASAVSWLAELGHWRVELQAGGAPAEQAFIMAVRAKALKDGVCETVLTRQGERYNSQATGGAERTVQTIRKQFKALMLAAEIRLKKKIGVDSAFLAWLPRHAAWLYNRYHVRADTKLTPYEKTHQKKYMNPVVEIGEAVVCRRPGAAQNKLELTWLEGLWLGRDARTNEHIIGTPTGVTRSRAIRRKVAERRWDPVLFESMTWTPWAPSPITRGRPPIQRSLQEPILLGPLPRMSGPMESAGAPAAAPAAPAAEAASSSAPVEAQAAASAEMPPAASRKKRTRDPADLGDDPDAQRLRINAICALQAVCEEALEYDEILKKRQVHVERIAGEGKNIVRVVPRSSATTRVMSGRWVDTADKSRWTTRGYEQRLDGTENHVANTPSLIHLKALLVYAETKGHVAAVGDCSGAFYQAPLKEERIFLEPPPEAQVSPDSVWEALCAFPGLKGAPKAWEEHSAHEMETLGMTRGRYDGCMFMRHSDEAKAGRHADDFLVTGPRDQVEELLEEMRQKLQLSDVVRLYEAGAEATFLSMNIRKIEGGWALKGKTSLIDDVLEDLGLQEAKASVIPQTKSDGKQKDDKEELSTEEHFLYRRCVGKMLQLAAHRPDIQYTVGVLSQAMSCPTKRDKRRIKKLARFLAGTRNVELILRPCKPGQVPVVQVKVDANWADDDSDRKSTSGGVLYYHGCAIATWSRRQACVALSSAESELYALGSGAVEALGFATLLEEWHEPTVPVLCSDSSSALHVVKKRGPGKMKHIALRMLALQEWCAAKRLRFEKVHTDDNESDLLTKPMTQERLVKLAKKIGLKGDIY